MTHVTVSRWGKSLAIRFPGDFADAAGLTEGELVEIETRDDQIVLRRAVRQSALEDLFQGHSPAEWRVAYANAYDWGPDVGRERIDE